MKITKVNLYKVSLPFKGEFSHAQRKGFYSKNIVIEIFTEEGIKGCGECAPRSFVTGETQQTVIKNLKKFIELEHFPWQLEDISQVKCFINSLPVNKNYCAATCAIETALLDLLGRFKSLPVINFFQTDFQTDEIYYGAGVPLADNLRVIEICELIRKWGISCIRMKMGRDLNRNKSALDIIRQEFNNDFNLRIDVNGAWDRELAFKHLDLIVNSGAVIIEQPMMPGDKDMYDFADVLRSKGISLMADESACSFEDIEKIIKENHFDMVNIRLSKCGGFFRTLMIIERLRNEGISFQIGCQLGESGILSAAGRTLSLLCSDALYHDGSYDELLLEKNITKENVTFGDMGCAGPLKGIGLGVDVDEERLRSLSDSESFVTIVKS